MKHGPERPGASANGFQSSVPAPATRKGGGGRSVSSLQCSGEEIPECRLGTGLVMAVSPRPTLAGFMQRAVRAAVPEKQKAQLDIFLLLEI